MALQARPADEIIVVWQGDDVRSRDVAHGAADRFKLPIQVVQAPCIGIVPAENAALAASKSEIVALIDDDAVPGPDWLARHLSHYADPTVGAVGGPFDNFHPDGTPFPQRTARPIGRLSWYGRTIGNMFDHDPQWRVDPARVTEEVQHLAGGNMSLRRSAFGQFSTMLRPYWQSFELEACLQVARNGYRVLFDYQNVVTHHPSSGIFDGHVEVDFEQKVYNPAYNMACALSLHSPTQLRLVRRLYLNLIGSSSMPGIAGLLVNLIRRPRRAATHWKTWRLTQAAVHEGWQDGRRARQA